MTLLLPNLALGLATVLALASLVNPERSAQIIGISFENRAGRTDFQGIYGGFFLAIYTFTFFQQDARYYKMLACGWIAATVVRAWSMIPKTRRGYAQYQGFLVETLISALLSTSFF